MPSGLVLAAGDGTRFADGPKQLALFRGRPLLETAVAVHCAVAELENVVVVLGAHADQIIAAVDFGRARTVFCAGWSDGLSASLKTGMQALSSSETVIVTLGDQPLITAALIRRFVGEPAGTRAMYGGKPGHPVVLGWQHLPMIEALEGDQGAGRLLVDSREIECGGVAAGANADVDTVEDLNEIRA